MSIAGEIIPKQNFYSYDAKYIDEKGADLAVPAQVSPATLRELQRLALATFQALECEGLARVDFFLTQEQKILVNELNSIPGFTKISMYPRLWEASGIPYTELIDRLIQLALERGAREKKLKISHDI